MSKRKIKVGFDFDGVIAYNPFRIIRPIMAAVKKNVFGVKKLKFWYPQKRWQQIFWTILHESSIFPSVGIGEFKKRVKKGEIEAHLITARYSFLEEHLCKWLDRYGLRRYFRTVNLNRRDEQPHLFKERLIEKYKMDIFIEDNLDIVKYLHVKQETKGMKHTKIYWIYNLLDRNYPYPHKFPNLEKALKAVLS